jgi:RNA polymerase sigma factor (sigma-70 family)
MKTAKNYTEEDIVQGIMENKRDVFEYLYLKLTPVIYSDIRYNNGSREDAEDHFQDTLLAAVANVKAGKYERGNFEGYFRTVSKNLWLKKLRNKGKIRTTELEEYHDSPDELSPEFVSNLIVYDKSLDLVNEKLNGMDESCQSVLMMFYHQKTGLDEIAKKFSWEYSYAKKKIFLCRQRLKEMLQTDKRFELQEN